MTHGATLRAFLARELLFQNLLQFSNKKGILSSTNPGRGISNVFDDKDPQNSHFSAAVHFLYESFISKQMLKSVFVFSFRANLGQARIAFLYCNLPYENKSLKVLHTLKTMEQQKKVKIILSLGNRDLTLKQQGVR